MVECSFTNKIIVDSSPVAVMLTFAFKILRFAEYWQLTKSYWSKKRHETKNTVWNKIRK